MKKKFTFMMALFALMLITLPRMVMGQTRASATWTASEQGYNNGDNVTNITIVSNVLNGDFAKSSGSNSPVYNNTDTGVRLYVNNTLTIKPVNGETITAVTLTVKCNKGGSGSSAAYPTSISVNSGSITSGSTPGQNVTSVVWSGSTTSDLVFTVNGSKGNVAVKVIAVTYTPAGPTQLAAPTNFAATAGNGQATFSWTAVDHASNYTIFAKNGDTWDNPTTLFDNVSLTNGQYVGTGLTNGTTYICKVRANGDGTTYSNSDLSDEYSVTPTGATQYTVTIDNSITGGSITANPTTAAAGTPIALTATPSAGYGFTSWNVYKTGEQSTTVEVSNNSFDMPGYDVTVSATFTAYTVTLNAGNGTVNSASTFDWNVTMNSGNLPNATSACDTWAFGGWSENAINTQTTTAPTYVATAYVPTSNITLYAVYTKTESGGSFDGTNGGDFLIYANVGGTNHYATGTISSSALTSTTTLDDAGTFTFEKQNNGNFTIKYGNSYISAASGSVGISASNTACEWTISASSNAGSWHVAIPSSTRGLIYRASTYNVFKNYASVDDSEYFDIEIGGGTTTYYHSTPSCTEQLATPTVTLAADNGSITPTWAAVSHASSYTLQYGTTSTFDENTYWSVTSATSGTAITANITNGTTYYVRVKAIGSGNYTDSEWSNVENATPVSVTTPTFSVDGIGSGTAGEYVEVAGVTITAPDYTVYDIYYTTDGSDPDNTADQYDGTTIDIIETTTIKAIAYEGSYASAISSITVNIAETTPVSTVYNASDSDNVYYIIDGIVTYKKSAMNMFIEDDNAGILVYGSNTTVAAGDKVYIKGTKTTYNGKPELKNMTILGKYGTGTLPAAEISISDADDYMYRRVKFTQVLVGSTSNSLTTIFQGDDNIGVYNMPSVTNVTDEGYYLKTITGIVAYYSNANQMYVASADDITSYTIEATSNNTALGTVTTSGYVVTATPASGVGYDDPAYVEVTTATDYDVQQTDNTFTIVTNGDMDIEIQFVTEAVLRNITFSVNGTVDGTLTREVIDGNPIGTLPSVSAPNGYVHMGWAETTISGAQAIAPTMVTSTTTVEDDMELYAVFAIQTAPAEEPYWSMITDLSTVTAGVYTLIDEDGYAFNGSMSSGHGQSTNDAFEFDSNNKATTAPDGTCELTLATSGSGYTMYNSTNGYLYASKAAAGGLAWHNEEDSYWYCGTLYNATNWIYSKDYSDSKAVLRVYNNTFRTYGKNSNDNLYMAKKNDGAPATYADYCTTVTAVEDEDLPINENNELTEDCTISGVKYLDTFIIVPDGKTLTITGVLGNDDPKFIVIEDGGQLVTSNPVKATLKKTTTASTEAKTPTSYWYAISSPVNEIAISSFATGTHNVYSYIEKSHYWNEYRGAEDPTLGTAPFTNLENGRGYLYRSTASGIDFKGDVNVDDATYSLTYTPAAGNLAGFHLIGNPYTHNIYKGVNAAINSDYLTDGLYTLNVNGGWVAGTDNTTVIAPGCAVLVQTTDAGEGKKLTITNTDHQGPQAKYANDQIMFTVENTEYSDNTYVLFKKGQGLNKIEHRNAEIPMLYVISEGENYAIADMPDNTDVINLGFEAKTMGQYTISLKAEGQYSYMHLVDKLTGNDIDMLVEDSYTFVGTPNDRNDRFVLRLNYNAAGIDTESDIFAYQSGNDIMVSGEGELQVFDITGRKVMTTDINGVETINGMNRGVYIFRLNEKTQKIVVR